MNGRSCSRNVLRERERVWSFAVSSEVSILVPTKLALIGLGLCGGGNK